MLRDLHEKGRGSRFLNKLTGTPLWELKPASRGGEKGGPRVYLFLMPDDEAGVVNCEVRTASPPIGRSCELDSRSSWHTSKVYEFSRSPEMRKKREAIRKDRKSKARVQADLRLEKRPDEDFMRLLAEAGDEDVVTGPALGSAARAYTPKAIGEAVIEGTVGKLLAQARSESGHSLSDIGAEAGVSRARIQQIEHSENIEVATLVRIAAACGYQVSISLRPLSPKKRALSAVLTGVGG